MRIADPQLSPDSRTVVYVRTTTDLPSGRRNADLWSVPADGGTAKELIGGDKAENTPRWSADGRRLVFISTRDGAAQVYVADADGSGIEEDHRSRDGRAAAADRSRRTGPKIAFVSDVYPECADEACNKRRKEEAEKNPVKVRRLTRLLYAALGRMARERPSSRVRGGRRRPGGPSTSRPATSIRRRASRRTRRSRSRRTAARSRSSRTAKGTTARPGRRTTTCGSCRSAGGDREEADAERRVPMCSRCSRRTAARIFVRAQRRPGFESDRWYLDAYDRASGAEAHRVRRARSLGRRLRAVEGRQRRSGSPPRIRAANTCIRRARRGRHAEADRRRRRDRRAAPGQRLRGVREIVARRRRPEIFRVAATGRQRRRPLTHENAAWLRARWHSRSPRASRVKGGAGGHRAVLADQAAQLRCVEEVSGRVPDSRRTAGRVGGCLVDALESVAVGGAGLGGRRAESARLDRLRPEVRRRDLAATGAAR